MCATVARGHGNGANLSDQSQESGTLVEDSLVRPNRPALPCLPPNPGPARMSPRLAAGMPQLTFAFVSYSGTPVHFVHFGSVVDVAV